MGQTNDKGTPVKKQTAKRKYDNQFVNFDLDKAQLAECKAWNLADGDVLLQVLAVCDDGYSVSVQADDRNNCYLAILRARVPGVNAGLLLSGRGSTPGKALKQVLFKHSLLDGDWTGAVQSNVGVMDD